MRNIALKQVRSFDCEKLTNTAR